MGLANTIFGSVAAANGYRYPDVPLTKKQKREAENATAGPKTSENVQVSNNVSQSGQNFFDPNLVQRVGGSAGDLATRMAGNYENIVNNPAGSQAYQNALSGGLAALYPSEQASRRSLTDQFRSAGNLASSSYAKGAAGLETGLNRNRNEFASNLMAKLYPAITQAAYAPISQANDLINAEKLSSATSSGSSSGNSTSWGFPPQQGGGGGGGGGSIDLGPGIPAFHAPSNASGYIGRPNPEFTPGPSSMWTDTGGSGGSGGGMGGYEATGGSGLNEMPTAGGDQGYGGEAVAGGFNADGAQYV